MRKLSFKLNLDKPLVQCYMIHATMYLIYSVYNIQYNNFLSPQFVGRVSVKIKKCLFNRRGLLWKTASWWLAIVVSPTDKLYFLYFPKAPPMIISTEESPVVWWIHIFINFVSSSICVTTALH